MDREIYPASVLFSVGHGARMCQIVSTMAHPDAPMGRWHAPCVAEHLEQEQALLVVKHAPRGTSLGKGRGSMSSFTSVLPGARVRTRDGFLGTVERLAQCEAASDGQPDCMIVRSDDGQWRYRLPLMLVIEVTQQAFNPVVTLNLEPDQLPLYILEYQEQGKAGREKEMDEEEGEPDLRIPLAVEELVVQKQPSRRGRIHIHKGVESEEKHISVPVYHEEAVIEHIPAEQYDGSGANNPNETIIPVMEERLVVQKQSFVREYIRIRKNIVEQRYDVHDTLRREVVEVTEHLDGAEQEAQPIEEDR